MKTKKWFIQHYLAKVTLATLAAAVTLLAAMPGRAADTSWVHGGNWADIQGNLTLVHYWAGISNATTLVQATNVADTIANDYTSIGIDFVRVAVNPATITSNWPVTQACINELIDQGLTVDIGCWYIDWHQPEGSGTITNLNNWKAMWQTIDGVYKTNDAVYFEPINEPFGYSLTGLTNLYMTFLNSYGIQKSHDHIILDGTGYSENVTGVGAAPGLTSCLLSLHDYAEWHTDYTTETQWVTNLTNVVGSYYGRTLITEMGAVTTNSALNYDNPTNEFNVSFIRGITKQCLAYGMGSTYFPATIPHTGIGTLNEKILYDKVGGTITNASMIDRLHYGWGMSNPHTRYDFNGDGQDDCVFFRPSDGTWTITYTSTGTTNIFQFGASNDIPLVSGDFDGDGIADAVVFRPSNSTWYIRSSAKKNQLTSFGFGSSGDVPLLGGDFDGDGIPDAVYWRPSVGVFHERNSSGANNTHVYTNGVSGDIPLLGGDFDHDGIPDVTVFRPSNNTWYVRHSSDGSIVSTVFGTNGCIPMLGGDFDGDGIPDLTYFNPADNTWHIRYSTTGVVHVPADGANGDIPFLGYASPDGAVDEMLYRPSTGYFYVRSSASGTVTPIPSPGISTDIPVY